MLEDGVLNLLFYFFELYICMIYFLKWLENMYIVSCYVCGWFFFVCVMSRSVIIDFVLINCDMLN